MCGYYTLRKGASLASVVVAWSLGASLAHAQEQPAATESEEIEVVLVTGSRIARPALEAPTPVLVLGSEDFLRQGFENFADLAASLPQFAPSFGVSRTQSTFAGAGVSGINGINLRNLGTERSVVLINGRRVPAGYPTSTSTVDFSSIPTAHIESIEVTTGGAAATYGADAVAGVINLITRKNFRGIEVGGSYGATSEGDNENPSGYLMFGGEFGEGGRGLLTIQVDNQGEVNCADRFLCAEDFAWLSPGTPVRGPAAYSGVGESGRFFAGGVGYTRRHGSFTDANGSLIPFAVAVDGYNRNRERTLAIDTRRVLFSAEGDHPVWDERIQAFAELGYGSAKTNAPFEAHPYQSNQPGSLFGGTATVAGLPTNIPANNPFIPPALRAALGSEPEMIWWQRFTSFGERGGVNERETVRVVTGLRGELPRDWSWDLSHTYGRHTLDSSSPGLVGTDRLYNGLRVEPAPARPGQFRCVDAGARALGCVPVNPFAPYTQEMIDYLSVTGGQRGRQQLEDTILSVVGKPVALPAGDLRVSAGLERRKSSGFLDFDEVINQGLVTALQSSDIDKAEIEVREAFVEAVAPLFGDKPFAELLSIEGAYRRSEPKSGDDYGTWKYGLTWAPLEDLRFRAMRARSVRAPTPGDLSGITVTAGVVADPCTDSRRIENATRAANCASDGVPTGYVPPLVVEQSVTGLVGGNPDVAPEESTSLTYGLVWTPSFVPGLSLTLDRFDIDLDGGIATVGRQLKANLCYDTSERLFCDDLTRGQDPAVPGANYVLKTVDDQVRNVASISLKGFDLETRYAFSLGAGRLGGQLLMTFYDEAQQVALPGQPPTDLLGFAGGSTSDQGFLRRQGTLNLNYAIAGFRVDWSTRYIGRTKQSPFIPADFPAIGSRVYHNLRGSYAFDDGKSEIYVGVTNLGDKQPPFFATTASGTQALDTIPGYYDVFGRSYFAGAKIRL